MGKKRKASTAEKVTTLLKTPLGALVYSFKTKPNKRFGWEFNLAFEGLGLERKRKSPAKKKETPKEEQPST